MIRFSNKLGIETKIYNYLHFLGKGFNIFAFPWISSSIIIQALNATTKPLMFQSSRATVFTTLEGIVQNKAYQNSWSYSKFSKAFPWISPSVYLFSAPVKVGSPRHFTECCVFVFAYLTWVGQRRNLTSNRDGTFKGISLLI